MKNPENKAKNTENKSEQTRALAAIILAAGKGTRMKSPLPKVLHPVAGRPMIQYVVEACQDVGVSDTRVVLGHGLNLVKAVVEPLGVSCFTQAQQLGTADAVKAAQLETLDGDVVIMNGDHPLITSEDLAPIIEQFRSDKLDLAVVTAVLKDPGAFGRVVRSGGQLRAIVEAKDASAETLKIREVNTGIYVVKADVLQEFAPMIKNQNAKGEYYLTDLISLAIENQLKVAAIPASKRVARGVNTQEELALASRAIFKRNAKRWMDEGVLMIDPRTVYIEEDVEVGAGAVIYPNVFLRGHTRVGSFSVIEPNCFLNDSIVEESVQIRAGSYLEQAHVKSKATVGPYARLRPETEIGEEAHVGNFVEMKKVKFGKKSKAGHLTYLGDAEVGENVNVGCGTITCNYAVDKKKYKTKIGNNVFVGSDTQFVAPVTVGDNAIIGSGSTITKDVPENALAVARGKQFVKEGYVKGK